MNILTRSFTVSILVFFANVTEAQLTEPRTMVLQNVYSVSCNAAWNEKCKSDTRYNVPEGVIHPFDMGGGAHPTWRDVLQILRLKESGISANIRCVRIMKMAGLGTLIWLLAALFLFTLRARVAKIYWIVGVAM